MNRAILAITIVVTIAALGGCASPSGGGANGSGIRDVEVTEEEKQAFLADKPAELHAHYEVTLRQGERNAVLNYLRVGLENLKLGNFTQAARDFDEAIGRIETIYADTEQARKARSNFTPEYVKDFKGDPYERAMAMFYRGLIFLENDDYENARASMLAGLEQDAMAEQEQYAKDFGMLYYLAGWASRCDGDDGLARDLFGQAREINPELSLPAPDDNLLVLGFVNKGPVKLRRGDHDEQLFYEPWIPEGASAGAREYAMAVRIQGAPVDLEMAGDIYYQATTRGGRAIDSINEGKAVFKDNTDAFGDVMTGAGLAALSASSYNRNGGNRNLGQAGAIMTLLGAAAKITSDLTKPEADIRYWDNLPEIVYMATAPKARLVHPLTPADVAVWVYNQAGEPVPVLQGVTPAVYPTTVTDRADCDWLGIEPRHHPLSPEHVNR